MIHLVYVSSATEDMSNEDLLNLLEQSRARNLRQNVTSMLLFAEGNFIQVLEGDEKDVEEIYSDILEDDRNSGNILIENEKIVERTFPEWSMGFKHFSASELKGHTNFLHQKMSAEQIANHSNEIVSLLYDFKKII